MSRRIESLRNAAFAKGKFDGYLILNSANLIYFLGSDAPAALLISAKDAEIVYVYGKNYEQTKTECANFKVESIESDENLLIKIIRQIKNCKIKRLAIDSLNVLNWQTLASVCSKDVAIEVNDIFIESLRRIKDKDEIERMRKAGELTSEGMHAACQAIKPGLKECEIAAEIEYAMRKKGSGSTAFESIVASGNYSAFPHGGCSERVIHEGDLVVVDIGATYKFYCSDMSRTFVAGKPSPKQQKIYNIVKEAQDATLSIIKSGVPIADVDLTARKVITTAGFGEYFVHRTGHGVGLDVHEPPSLTHLTKDLLVAGNVVTIEPGIYIPNFGGVRIEDTVLVTKTGYEKLTNGPYCLSMK